MDFSGQQPTYRIGEEEEDDDGDESEKDESENDFRYAVGGGGGRDAVGTLRMADQEPSGGVSFSEIAKKVSSDSTGSASKGGAGGAGVKSTGTGGSLGDHESLDALGNKSSNSRRPYLRAIPSDRSINSSNATNESKSNAENLDAQTGLCAGVAAATAGGVASQSANNLKKLRTRNIHNINNSNKNNNNINDPVRRSMIQNRAPASSVPGRQAFDKWNPTTATDPNQPQQQQQQQNTVDGAAVGTPPPIHMERAATERNAVSSARRANLFVNRLAVRTTSRLASERKNRGSAGDGNGRDGTNLGGGDYTQLSPGSRPNAIRRYKPGDNVLVCNQQNRWSTLVNRHGFPPGEGATPEEMRGPYIYALATVKQVHFEEFAAYYTVTRADTGAEQRADADFMEPIRTVKGEQAAFRAAMQSSPEAGEMGDGGHFVVREIDDAPLSPGNKVTDCLEYGCFLMILPFLWIYDYLVYFGTKCLEPVRQVMTAHARLFLYGLQPYACQARITVVNLIVLCSFWYMFIDQARLAFFPPRSDFAVAIFNFVVWSILLGELACEVFIRPDGYQSLITSEKAFAPQTVRYMNKLHLLVEMLCLALFVPEFVCIFSQTSCSERFPFSFFNAALMAVTGPTRVDSVYGRCYFALVRLRVFGLVRHWKNMWITTTFLAGKKRVATGFWSNIFPQRPPTALKKVTPVKRDKSKDATSPKHATVDPDDPKDGGENDNEQIHKNNNKQDSTLINASNIGTALMVTNSYRAIALLWVITGLFPVITHSIVSRLINNVASEMTVQLLATNLLSNDTSNQTCAFLVDSIRAWVLAVVAPDVAEAIDDPYLVTLTLEPYRCNISVANLCNKFNLSSADFESLCEQRAALHNKSHAEIADFLGIRVGSVVSYYDAAPGKLLMLENNSSENWINTTFSVESTFDQTYSIRTAALDSLLLQIILLFFVLGGLSILRRDAEVLVLGPLRRMLKIVARYAKNPLVPPKVTRARSSRRKYSQRLSSNNDDDSSSSSSSTSATNSEYESSGAWRNDQFALGSYETEQLIAAITKITDLLRKCWGVAGADIISTNLATREGALTDVFNPTVPGKSVYALFAFAAINDFDHALRNLGGDVMILINDVASVLHGEVFRWGFGDSGQCNKNLGGAFLMVFRIGLVKEVIKKLEQATDVIFSANKASQNKATQQALTRRRANKLHHQQQQQTSLSALVATGQGRRATTNTANSGGGSSSPGGTDSVGSPGATSSKSGAPHSGGSRSTGQSFRRVAKIQRTVSVRAMSLSLASLPGISTFTDRAVIGMLKAFASIHRDQKLRSWNRDFRLGAGVGAFTVSMIYGMDAGWAVEGAVGSEYKIDATYLSPHVNMASRMMSACKQYGVTILLSQAVEELMSDVARSKLRHLDTVTVKGSSVKQKIFTYDARHTGADFFLFSRSDDQADVEAERYTPLIWNTDPDLNAMRRHITDEFLHEFEEGRKMFLLGEWTVAKRRLEKANELMVQNAMDSGYLEAELEQIQMESLNPTEAADELKRHNGDGPSQCILNFIKSNHGNPPSNWEGWHPLTRK